MAGLLPAFVAVTEPVLPLPLAASPIEGLLLVHVKADPAGVLAKTDAGIVAPLHRVRFESGFTAG
jgi:hypothetical protein